MHMLRLTAGSGLHGICSPTMAPWARPALQELDDTADPKASTDRLKRLAICSAATSARMNRPAAPAPRAPRQRRLASDETLFARGHGRRQRMRSELALDHDRSARCMPARASRPEEDEVDRPAAPGGDAARGSSSADTPEYMEGVGCPAPPRHRRAAAPRRFCGPGAHGPARPHRGRGARASSTRSCASPSQAGKRAVLIIHGRGLSSPADPVLKTKVAAVAQHRPVAQVGRRLHQRPHVRRRLRGKLCAAAPQAAHQASSQAPVSGRGRTAEPKLLLTIMRR
ncbi:MAG: hypothetical protein MZV70_53295 [Desulfobacterales bacterium]|nr:hypothetical protein [Desulfobacterales bacterium]